MGIVFQDFQLLIDRTVYDNLYFVLHATGWNEKTDANKRIREVLEKVDLETRDLKMPHQLSGVNSKELSSHGIAERSREHTGG